MGLSFLRVPLLFCVIILLFVTASCDSKRFYEENFSIEKAAWNNTNKAKFNVVINDTKSTYSLYLNVRNTGEYPYSNLFLFMKTTYPDGRFAIDTIECTLADNEGKWLGSGISDTKFNRLLFHRGVRFPKHGNYGFELEQAMRTNELKGISEVGIRIDKE